MPWTTLQRQAIRKLNVAAHPQSIRSATVKSCSINVRRIVQHISLSVEARKSAINKDRDILRLLLRLGVMLLKKIHVLDSACLNCLLRFQHCRCLLLACCQPLLGKDVLLGVGQALGFSQEGSDPALSINLRSRVIDHCKGLTQEEIVIDIAV